MNKFKSTVSFAERLAYGCGDLASNLIFVGISAFLAFFYTDVAGIPALVVGNIFLISRLLDGVSDLAMGIVMEKVRSKHGKARCWLLWMSVPYGVGAVLLFSVPPFDLTGKIIYAFVTYNLMTTVIYTAINIPYGVLNSLISQNPYDRTLLNTFRMVSAYVGAIIVSAVTLPMVDIMGGGSHGWMLTYSVFGIMATCLFLVTYRFTKERVTTVSTVSEQKKPEFNTKKALKSLLTNKYWLIMVVFNIMLYGLYALLAIYTYYAKYILGDADLSSMMFTLRNIVELCGVILAVPIVKRFGKRNVALLSTILIIMGQAVMIFEPVNYTVILMGLCLGGLGVGATFGIIFAMIADTIEYEEWRSGVRAEGMVYGAASVGQKAGTALSGAAIGWLLHFAGYQESAVDIIQPQTALSQISFIFLWLPLIMAVIMAILMVFYKLDKEYGSIVQDLEARRKNVQDNTTI